jgi:hypothetical protein
MKWQVDAPTRIFKCGKRVSTNDHMTELDVTVVVTPFVTITSPAAVRLWCGTLLAATQQVPVLLSSSMSTVS